MGRTRKIMRFGQKICISLVLVLLLSSCGNNQEAPSQETDPSTIATSETVTEDFTAEEIDSGEALLNTHMQKILTQPIKEEEPFNFKGLKDVQIIGALTGEYSINRTKSNYQVYGTDIGVIFNKGEEIFFAFGDTFSEASFAGNWRSNVMAYTTDKDASDGILFDGMIMNRIKSQAMELISSKKRDNDEMTTIPTGGFSIGDDLYLCYMSVRHWGDPGEWDCNYGGLAKSEDNGQTWTKLTDLRWDGEGNFVQLYPVKDGEYLYFYGIGGGRTGQISLMRVRIEDVEDKSQYEYITGMEDAGAIYQKGVEAEQNPYAIINRPAGELSVMYNEYLEEWTITYLCGEDLIMRSSKTIEGPFSGIRYIAKQSDYPGLYGAFMHPFYTEDNGRIVYMMMSLWDPIYNVVIVKAEVVR